MIEPLSKQDLVALVDQLILEQGRLDPLELLMAWDDLAYADDSGAHKIPQRAALARVRPDLLKLYLAARATGTRRGPAQT